jgi:hypothetical protein
MITSLSMSRQRANIMGWLQRHLLFFIILAIGVLLRWWDVLDLEFHHDEISALLRTRFDGFNSLIDQGVRVDGHPAFTQWFLWFWVGVVGYTPWLVKLPFLIAGTLSLVVFYGLAKEVFDKNVALLAMAWFAVAQPVILYAQWARPYAFALCFMLLALYGLLRWLKTDKRTGLFLFIITSALTAYTHYFAVLQLLLLTALMLLFKATWKQRMVVFLASLLAIALWLPHAGITLDHLALKGIGDWLQPPTSDAWIDVLGFSMHYSWLFALPFLPGVLFVVLETRKRLPLKWMFITSAAWLAHYVITYVYSHEVSPVLHMGTMLFAFPSLVLSISSLFQRTSAYYTRLTALAVLLIGMLTLVDERHHYQLNGRTEFQTPFAQYEVLKEESDVGLKTAGVFDLRPDAVDLLDRVGIIERNDVVLIEEMAGVSPIRFFQALDADAILLVTTAATPPEWRAEALAAFPDQQWMIPFNTGQCEWLMRGDGMQSAVVALDSTSIPLAAAEFGKQLRYEPELREGRTFLVVRAKIEGNPDSDVQLVLDWQSKHGDKHWQSAHDLKEAQGNPSMPTTAVDLRDLDGLQEGGVVTCYVWNPNQSSCTQTEISIELWPSNPLRYGLFQAIPEG